MSTMHKLLRSRKICSVLCILLCRRDGQLRHPFKLHSQPPISEPYLISTRHYKVHKYSYFDIKQAHVALAARMTTRLTQLRSKILTTCMAVAVISGSMYGASLKTQQQAKQQREQQNVSLDNQSHLATVHNFISNK